MSADVFVYGDGDPKWLFARTVRSLVAAGVSESRIRVVDVRQPNEGLPESLQGITDDTSLWFLKAGAWLPNRRWRNPPDSRTGRPVIAVGRPLSLPVGWGTCHDLEVWDKVHRESEGDLESYWRAHQLSISPLSLWMSPEIGRQLIISLQAGAALLQAIHEQMSRPLNRLVYWADLNVGFDRCRRIVQVITSLQRGGAERLALDLHECWLQQAELTPLLVALGAPTRDAYSTPRASVELSQHGARSARVKAAADLMQVFGADLIHSHLLNQDELRTLSETRVPQMATIHNARQGWTMEADQLEASDVSLLVGCSMAVESDIRDAGIPVPSRTIWNGIHPVLYQSSDREKLTARAVLTEKLGIENDSFLLVCVANVRPQKRMERLPVILRMTQDLLHAAGAKEEVHLLIAGERSSGNEASSQSEILLGQSIVEYGEEPFVHRLGSVTNICELLAAADLMISASDYEGLSLAHLEAVAAGVPVVATAVGGTCEIDREGLHVLPVPREATEAEFARVIVSRLNELRDVRRSLRTVAADDSRPTGSASVSKLPRHFHLFVMAERYQQFYSRVMGLENGGIRKGLWLIINNLSTGGAQSSARRLLCELKRRGHEVRVALLQESPDHPTPGRLQLLSADIPVLTLIPAGRTDPLAALQPLLLAVEQHPPEAIVLWNVIAEYKMLLSDLLYSHRVFDVSPGEMNFQSLEKYFAKPRAGLPYLTGNDYGRRLAGAIVKFRREQQIAREILGAPVAVIPNGIALPEQCVQHVEKSVVVLGTAARISPQKKLEDLLSALRIAHSDMPPYELRIAGAPECGCEEYFDLLRRVAEGLHVRWMGDVQNMTGFLLSLDVFVMISHPAGCPNASLEAMAVGLPVIATDVGGVNEQVIDGKNGRLVPPSNTGLFAAAIVELSGRWQLRKEYGCASRQHVEVNFSLQRMADAYEQTLGLARPDTSKKE